MNSSSVIKAVLISWFFLAGTLALGQVRGGVAERDSNSVKSIKNNVKSDRIFSARERLPLIFLKNDFLPFTVPNLKSGLQNGNFQNGFSPWDNLQSNISMSYKILQRQRRSTDLGFMGKVLNYANFAAAIGLAAYSVHKYGWRGEKIPTRKNKK